MHQTTTKRERFVERFERPEECSGFEVRDLLGRKVGSVKKLFLNGRGEPEYVEVKTGLLGPKSILIPVQGVATNEQRRTLVLPSYSSRTALVIGRGSPRKRSDTPGEPSVRGVDWFRGRAEGEKKLRATDDERDPRESRKQIGIKYAQFSLVGGSNALVDLGVLNLLLLIFPTRSPEPLVVYNVVALVLTNANSYLWNTLWTFRHRARHDARQVGLFTGQAAMNVAVGGLLLWLLAHWLVAHTHLSPLVGGNVAKVVSMLVASTMSFLFLRFFVFRGKAR